MRPLRISVDFDGTVVEGAFPDIGEPMPDAVDVLSKIASRDHHIILNTCCENRGFLGRQHLAEAVRWFTERGIPLRSVNVNHPDDGFRDTPGRKVYADFHVDDRNLGGFQGWNAVLAEVDRRRPM